MAAPWEVELAHGPIGVRPLRRSDASRWAELRRANASWLTPWDATLPPEGGQQSTSYRQMIAVLRRRAKQSEGMPFVSTWNGEMVGQVSVSSIVWGSARSASIGYWVAADHAGRGITPTAVALVCDHLFTRVGLHRIDIAIRPENHPSLAVVRRLGFADVGLAPRYLHIAGRWSDHRLFQLTTEDVHGRVLDRL
ncbi:GNAT family N-acetyltransferase [Aeromicrobium sp. Leaf350]|uniref:GNAT family N-acetyltransferase n=1 Tax=Aeromicrobium sp. Leaf350 TaxID=2876565 RepID=UPI001E365E5B|nr:GNAT family protein [Aeromicrobium sp. Leaf350]